MPGDEGELFQEKTKYWRGRLSGGKGPEKWPGSHKSYPGAARITLPSPEKKVPCSLWSCLEQRRSIRHFRDQPLSAAILSLLLWASQGITAKKYGLPLRTAPSAGALYPIETYLSIQKVTDIPAGIYHYDVAAHALERLNSGQFGLQLSQAALDQHFIAEAAVVFIWTAIFARSSVKYRQRAYRYVYLDAGHIAQNLALAAVACDLGSCQVGAFYDEEVNLLLGVDGREESAIYLTAIGYPWTRKA